MESSEVCTKNLSTAVGFELQNGREYNYLYRIFSIKRPGAAARRLIKICGFDQAFFRGRRVIGVGSLLMKYSFLFSIFFFRLIYYYRSSETQGQFVAGGTAIFPFVLSLDLRG